MAQTVRADTGVDLGAVIQDAACVGKRLESPLSVVLAHPRVAYPSELKSSQPALPLGEMRAAAAARRTAPRDSACHAARLIAELGVNLGF
jgi:hypothetical protein